MLESQPSSTDPDHVAAARAALAGYPDSTRFRERLPAKLRRWGLGAAYALTPKRIGLMPRLTLMTLGYLTSPVDAAPSPEPSRYHGPRGLIGISNDLSVDSLLNAYRYGAYPHCHIGPIKWWSPERRAVLAPEETHISSNMRRLLRQGRFTVTFDRDFASVIEKCAEPRPGKTPLTWITPRIMNAYWDLHLAGHAHSVEVWDGDGRLVGGLYGVAFGEVFSGESQFAKAPHASKVAVTYLHAHLAYWGFKLRDAKNMTAHLASLGFGVVDRESYENLLWAHAWTPGRVGAWAVEPTLDVAGWRPGRPQTLGDLVAAAKAVPQRRFHAA